MATQDLSLSALCGPTLSFALSLRGKRELTPEEVPELQGILSNLLDGFERESAEAGFQSDDIKDAKYAQAAFVDEIIGISPWEGSSLYLRDRLAAGLSPHPDAGVHFFEILDSIEADFDRRRHVAEVFFTCLSLGFKGKYVIGRKEERGRLIDRLRREFDRVQLQDSRVTPRAYRDLDEPLPRRDLRPWLVWIIAAAIVLIAYVAFLLPAQSQANRAVDEITRVAGSK